jgi:endonuclease III
MNHDYKLLFEKIESSLMQNLNIHSEVFIKRILPFKDTKHWDFRNRTNENIFWVLSYITFFGQNDPAHLIEGQFNNIYSELCSGPEDNWIEWEVDFDSLSNLSVQEKNRLITETLKFGRWGSIKGTDFSGIKIVGMNRYLKWIIENASQFSKLVRSHNNSFAEYVRRIARVQDLKQIDLTEYDSKNPIVIALHKDLKNRFSGFGERTTYHFLGDLGFNVNKPDTVVCRILYRLGLIDSESDIENALIQVQNFANQTGNIGRYIDIILVKFGQKGNSPILGTKNGICLDNPNCSMCMLTSYCRYYQNQKRGWSQV